MNKNNPLPQRRLRFALRELLLVALGAVPGALLRWQAGGSATAHLLVNVVGSFCLGVLAGPIPFRTSLVLLLGIGFCGSLTTFSSWMVNSVALIAQGDWASAVGLLALTLGLGLGAAAVGFGVGRHRVRPTPSS